MHPSRLMNLVPVLHLACAASSPEDKVKRAFEACVKGVETGDVGTVIERLDPAFTGPEGMDRATAKLYLIGVLRREKVRVTIFSSSVKINGHEAIQTVELLLTSRSGGLIPQDASRRTFLLRWAEADGTWRLRELLDGTAG